MTDAEAQSAAPSAPAEDKPQPERKVIATLVQGTVKWFNVRNGYGFINRNDTKEDVFVHQTAIKKNNPRKFLRSVGDGEVVEFDVIEATKGSEAANVTGPGGVPVKGSRYAPNKRRFRRRLFPRSPRPGDQPKPADGQAPAFEGDESGTDGSARPPPPQQRRRPRRPRQDVQEVVEDEYERTSCGGSRRAKKHSSRRRSDAATATAQILASVPKPAEGEQATAPEEAQEQPEVPEVHQTNGEEPEGQKQRRQPRRRRQRTSESSTSKNDTEKSASEPGTPPQSSKSADLKSTPKSPKSSPKASPKTPKSPEQAAAATTTTVPAPAE